MKRLKFVKVFRNFVAISLALCMLVEGIGISTVKADDIKEFISDIHSDESNTQDANTSSQFKEWVENEDYKLEYLTAPDNSENVNIIMLNQDASTEEAEYNITRISNELIKQDESISVRAITITGALITVLLTVIGMTVYNIIYEMNRADYADAQLKLLNSKTMNGWIMIPPRTHDKPYKLWGYKENGKVMKQKWIYYKNEWFYMDAQGIMVDVKYARSPWIAMGGYWFWFDPAGDGKLIKKEGWYQNRPGKWMYFKKNYYGAYYNQAVQIDGVRCYFNADGYCYKGKYTL